jgi:hypothetical protein
MNSVIYAGVGVTLSIRLKKRKSQLEPQVEKPVTGTVYQELANAASIVSEIDSWFG